MTTLPRIGTRALCSQGQDMWRSHNCNQQFGGRDEFESSGKPELSSPSASRLQEQQHKELTEQKKSKLTLQLFKASAKAKETKAQSYLPHPECTMPGKLHPSNVCGIGKLPCAEKLALGPGSPPTATSDPSIFLSKLPKHPALLAPESITADRGGRVACRTEKQREKTVGLRTVEGSLPKMLMLFIPG